MSNDYTDRVIGLAVCFAVLAGVVALAGVSGLLYVLFLVVYGSVALYLWSANSRIKKVLAVFMMPIILISLIPGATTKTLHRVSGLKKSSDQSTKSESS